MANKLQDRDYIALGKQMQAMLDENYAVLQPAWPQRIKISIIRGFFTGIAGVVGATIGIAVLIGILSVLGALPGIGEFFTNIANQLSSGK